MMTGSHAVNSSQQMKLAPTASEFSQGQSNVSSRVHSTSPNVFRSGGIGLNAANQSSSAYIIKSSDVGQGEGHIAGYSSLNRQSIYGGITPFNAGR
jgi:hypothetical protein